MNELISNPQLPAKHFKPPVNSRPPVLASSGTYQNIEQTSTPMLTQLRVNTVQYNRNKPWVTVIKKFHRCLTSATLEMDDVREQIFKTTLISILILTYYQTEDEP